MNRTPINVAVLGCTGAVGQKLVSLLSGHPRFRIAELVASERSAGIRYADRVNWKEAAPIPEAAAGLMIRTPEEPLRSRILFSGLDASIAGTVESRYAGLGHIVVSNSRNHRMDPDVPLIIPEINAGHLELIRRQASFRESGGFIVTNPNCSTIVLALALFPVHARFGLDRIIVTTLQAISGAGYPGIPAMDILGNTVPFIGGEEEKMETELLKIFGEAGHNADFTVSATCNRVPVRDGHTVCASFSTRRPADREGILEAMAQTYPRLGLHFSPEEPLRYLDAPDRPQPLLDASAGHGMTVSAGRLRPCPVLGWKLTAFGHNTVRGAAGAAILNAELIAERFL